MHDGGALHMRLKYQLRGLGIGIILTAALLMVFSDEGKTSVKADDIEMAANTESEMAESSEVMESLSEEEVLVTTIEETLENEESSQETETISEEEQITQIETEEELVLTSEADSVEEVISEETSELANDLTGIVKIKIVGGDDSGTVARKLQVAGLVDNASEFDAYLMQHGYDKKIAVGEKNIPIDATWMEIAEKISSR